MNLGELFLSTDAIQAAGNAGFTSRNTKPEDASGGNDSINADDGLRSRRRSFERAFGFATVIALLLTGTTTFLILFGLTPLEPNSRIVQVALAVNTLLAGVLVLLIGLEIWRLLASRKRGRAAARLHIRIVGLFALVAAIPAVIVAVVAAITLDLGLDRWFEQRTKAIIQGSVGVAEAYVDESSRTHINATISMATELDRARQLYSLDRSGFENVMRLHTRGRGMLAAYLLRDDGSVIIEVKANEEVQVPPVPKESLDAAKSGDVIFIPRGRTSLVGAVMKLRVIPDAFLYTVRPLRDDVLQALRQMEQNTSEYDDLQANRLPVQLTFAVLYFGIALMILLAAIWMGMSVADRFVRPIRRLIFAADEVSDGNLDVRVETKHTEGDFKNLSDTFNVMTHQLRMQRSELLSAKDDIDRRARFTEAVLSGVTAAVIGVDSSGEVQIANRAAINMFGKGLATSNRIGSEYSEVGRVLENAIAFGKSEYLEQVTMMLDGISRTLNVQVTQERESGPGSSFVITIDDITDLVAAQRSTAWSDVARRIAHEIKNPLTPIQLSAERLRRRYSKYITEDKETFDQCTDTIVRHVGDIGRMVDEFSSFARMPKPEMTSQDLAATVKEAVFSQRVANPDVEFTISTGEGGFRARYDSRLISQALINILKNAVEAIELRPENEGEGEETAHKGRIHVRMARDGDQIRVDVIDNGRGLPDGEARQKLLEPYMTTRQKGTGLGLAIVRKIFEDHDGTILLMDAPPEIFNDTGAMLRLILPAEGGIFGKGDAAENAANAKLAANETQTAKLETDS